MAMVEHNLSFASDLWDGFSLVAKKSDCGLQSCKDILAFYRKRAQIEEEYSKALVKLCISATSEKRMIFKGRGSSSVIAESASVIQSWESVIAATERAAKIHGNTAKKLTETCAESVSSFIKDLEQKQKQYVSEGNRLTKEYEDACTGIEKLKANFYKMSMELEIAEKAHEDAKSDKDIAKSQQKLEAAKDKAKQSDKEYKDKLILANQLQDKYNKDQMPKILTDLEKWESMRIRLIKANMKKYVSACERVPEVLSECNRIMVAGLERIDVDSDIKRFIEENKTYNEPPAPIEYEPYIPGSAVIDHKKKFDIGDITANLARKATVVGNKLTSGNSSTSFQFVTKEERPSETVFDLSLEQIMAKQKDKSQLEVPEVLEILTSCIISFGGKSVEGIFRVPASTQQVQALKKQIIQGDYNINKATDDPHVPAAILKLWLRGLPDPLIPNNLYDAAIGCIDESQVTSVFNKVPIVNQKVIRHLMKFLGDLAQPETVKVTKMNVDNLAMVFAPSLLRCPSEEPLQILAKAKNEQFFTKLLLLSISSVESEAFPGADETQNLIDFEKEDEDDKSEDIFKHF